LGLPDWDTVEYWMDPNTPIPDPGEYSKKIGKPKCPEIPILDSYRFPPSPGFWHHFPSHPLPTAPTTPINIPVLEEIIGSVHHKMTSGQKERARTLISDLQNGVSLPLKDDLPMLRDKNSPSVLAHGQEFTDIVGSWVKSGYVAGPFIVPPVDDFRSNSMLAIEQPGKIRAIMNMSSPKDKSFNDALEDDALEQIHMATARHVGYSIVECGKDSLIWKWDMVDAYKHIPASLSDLKYQGFCWLGRYFIETQQVFGAASAVSAYDRLNHTLAVVAAILADFPANRIHRVLDDLPVVDRSGSEAGPRFCNMYTALCEKIGVKLAPLCPNNEKAFEAVREGTVLGIRFRTKSLTWSLPTHKKDKIVSAALSALSEEKMTLENMQILMGLLNDLGQMLPFLRGFRHNLNAFLATLLDPETEPTVLPIQAAKDLKVWALGANTAASGLPIPHKQPLPSMAALTFVSDAAGARFAQVNGRFIPYGKQNDRGAASISALEDGPVWFCARITWPTNLLLNARDSADHAYGCKSPTLEAVAMILPFLCCPEKLIGREVLLLTDNEAIVFGWDSRKVTNDESASILIKTLHLIASYLGSWVTVQHLPRMSTDSAKLADHLTRKSTTKKKDLRAIRRAEHAHIPWPLLSWLHDPFEDWELPHKLLQSVKSRIDDKNIKLL
jgi:hypothetical protein